MSRHCSQPSPPFCRRHCPGSCWGAREQREMLSLWGTRGGLPCLWPGSAHILTPAPPTTLCNHHPHAHAPALCISQKPLLFCSAKNLGLAASCGGPLECRFPVPAPVCQPWQRPRGRMGDHQILSGMGRLAAMSHWGGVGGWGAACCLVSGGGHPVSELP